MRRWRLLPSSVRQAFIVSASSVVVTILSLAFLGYVLLRNNGADAACGRQPGCFAEDPTGAYVMLLGTPLLVLLLWQFTATVGLTRGRGLVSGVLVSTVWLGIDVLAEIYSPRNTDYTRPMAALNLAVIVLLWRARPASWPGSGPRPPGD